MPDFKNYDPATHTLIFKGHEVRGYAEGTHISVERVEDSFKVKAGARGDVVRTRMHNKIGSITVTLLPTSSSNTFFSALLAADEAGTTVDAGVGAGMLKDSNGRTLMSGESCWLRRLPKKDVGDEAQNVEWVIDVAALKGTVGGSIR